MELKLKRGHFYITYKSSRLALSFLSVTPPSFRALSLSAFTSLPPTWPQTCRQKREDPLLHEKAGHWRVQDRIIGVEFEGGGLRARAGCGGL